MTPNILRIIMRSIVAIGIIFLIGAALLEVLPVLPNSVATTVSIVHRVNQQGALAERIDKDVLTLAYRPQSERVQALSELQVTLPTFEKVQAGLQGGDVSLNLPMQRPQDVQLLLLQSQSDYMAIDTAVKAILAHTNQSVDPNQIAIIQQHERPYFLAMNYSAKVWEDHVEGNALGFFWVELWMSIILIILTLAWMVLPALNSLFVRFLQRKEQARGHPTTHS